MQLSISSTILDYAAFPCRFNRWFAASSPHAQEVHTRYLDPCAGAAS